MLSSTLTFCPMKLHMLFNKYDFKRRFSIHVYRLDETVSLWKSTEIIEELQQQVKVAAATTVLFYLSTNILQRSDACIASQGQHFQHFL